jgi:hypothetical protein
MAYEEESRFCPYCGEKLKHPYWQHVQKEHPNKYAQKETWVKLYQDYIGVGMDKETSLKVISELFNATEDEIESFLRNADAL